MAARAEARRGRGLAAILVLPLAVFLIAMASLQLSALSGAYRPGDVFLTHSPRSLQAWLAELAAEAAGPGADRISLARRIADRLVLMPLPDRRKAIVAMTHPEFWNAIVPKGSTPRAIKEIVLAGTLLALAGSPAAGDLYFAAAWLETGLDGYAQRPRRMLEASHVFSPREIEIVIERVRFAPLIWTFAGDGERQRLTADFHLVREAFPREADQIAVELARHGVVIE